MKKIRYMVLLLVCLFSLSACGSNSGDASESTSPSSTESAENTTVSEGDTESQTSESEESTEAPTEETTRFPVNDATVTQAAGEEFITLDVPQLMTVTTNVKAYEQPGSVYIVTIVAGPTVRRLAYNNTWSLIVYSGKQMYVESAYLTFAEESAQ